MSEQSGGPGWWQASDGKWYPPEQAPTAAQPPVDPTTTQPAAGTPAYGAPPPGAPAYGAPAYGAPPAGAAAAGGGGAGKVIAIVVVLALLAGGGAYLLTKGSGSSGSVKSFCDTARTLNNDTSLNNNNFDDPATVDKVVSAFTKLANASPSEIKADMNTLTDGLRKAAAAIKTGKNPDTALSQADKDKFDAATVRVNTFAEKNCGFGLTGSSSDSSFDSSFSFDTSSFDSSLSSQFSTFDDSSFSSELSSLCDQFGSDFPGCSGN
ncbi:MAG: hypothetical protein QOI95_1453 [Acidimicrobiaceae bacterium]|jgi:hypothetical protein